MEWKTVKLGEVANVQTGPFGSQLHNEDYVIKGTPIVTVEHLGARVFSTQNLPCVSDADKERLKKYTLKEGDVVFSRVGSVDRCSYVSSNEEGWLFSGRCLRVRTNEEVYPLFLYYYLQKEDVKQSIRNIAVGATMPSINTKLLSEIEVTYPSHKEQLSIAAILSSLDDKIENNNRINRNLEAQAQALFKSWFVDFEPFGGTMPDDWKEGTIADVVNLLNGFAFKSSDFVANGFYNLITIKGVQDGKMTTDGADHLDATPAKMPNWCLLKKGDILLSLTGNVGRCCLVDIENCLLNQRVAKLQPRAEYNRLFVYTLFRQEEMKSRMISISRGTAQMNLSPIETGKLSIIVPTDKVLEDFGMRYNGILDTILNNISESHRLAALRDTLLPKLMKGEIAL